MIQPLFRPVIWALYSYTLYLKLTVSNLGRTSSTLRTHVIDFRFFFVSFRTQSAPKVIAVENRGHISDFLTHIKLEKLAIANALQLEAARATAWRQPFPALITTPCQVWSPWTYTLPYYSVFAADTLLNAVTLTFDLWSWTFAAYRLWRDETLYQIWTQSNNPRRSYCDFSVWPYDLEHMLRSALG